MQTLLERRFERNQYLSDAVILHGLTIPGAQAMLEASSSTLLDIWQQIEQGERLIKIMRYVHYHRGMVALFDEFPEVDAITFGNVQRTFGNCLTMKIKLRYNTQRNSLPDLQKNRAKKRFKELQKSLNFKANHKKKFADLFLFWDFNDFSLNRDNGMAYLDAAMGPKMVSLWRRMEEHCMLVRATPGQILDQSQERARL